MHAGGGGGSDENRPMLLIHPTGHLSCVRSLQPVKSGRHTFYSYLQSQSVARGHTHRHASQHASRQDSRAQTTPPLLDRHLPCGCLGSTCCLLHTMREVSDLLQARPRNADPGWLLPCCCGVLLAMVISGNDHSCSCLPLLLGWGGQPAIMIQQPRPLPRCTCLTHNPNLNHPQRAKCDHRRLSSGHITVQTCRALPADQPACIQVACNAAPASSKWTGAAPADRWTDTQQFH